MQDPILEDLPTVINAPKCPKCSSPYVYSNQKRWACDNCGSTWNKSGEGTVLENHTLKDLLSEKSDLEKRFAAEINSLTQKFGVTVDSISYRPIISYGGPSQVGNLQIEIKL